MVMETVKTGRKCRESVAVQFRSMLKLLSVCLLLVHCIQTMLLSTSIEPHKGTVNIILSIVLSASF